MRGWLIFPVLLVSLVFTACGGQETRPIPTAGIYRPPIPVATEVPSQLLTREAGSGAPVEEARPTPTPECTNSLWFLDDLTIPDGTIVNPGERLDKRWQVRNNGTCNWDERYHVKLIAGPALGVPVQQALFPALSGTDVIIRMVFIAPDEPGAHRSAWQAYDPQGEPFGDLFFIDVIVPEADSRGD